MPHPDQPVFPRMCEWHDGETYLDCPECQGLYEAYMENLADEFRSEARS